LAAYEYATPKGAKEITVYIEYDNSIEYNRFVTLDIGEYLKYEVKESAQLDFFRLEKSFNCN